MTIPETETFWDCVEQATADEDYEALQACQNLYEPMAPAEPVISLESGFDGAPGSGSEDDPFQISFSESGEGFQYLTTWSIKDPDDDVTWFDHKPTVTRKNTIPGLFQNQSDMIIWLHPEGIGVACSHTIPNKGLSGLNPPASGTFKRLCENQTETLKSGSYKWTFDFNVTESGQVIDPEPTVYFDVIAPAEPVISLESGFDGAPGSGSEDDPFQISFSESGEGFQYLTTWSIKDPDDDVTLFDPLPTLSEKHIGLNPSQPEMIFWVVTSDQVRCINPLVNGVAGLNPPALGSFKRLCENQTETLKSGSYKWTFNNTNTESGQVIDPKPTVYFEVTAPADAGDRANDDRSTGGTRR